MSEHRGADERVESDYSRQTVKRRGLRTGYTTGSCSAAAAKAATLSLLTGEAVLEVTISLPVGREATFLSTTLYAGPQRPAGHLLGDQGRG